MRSGIFALLAALAMVLGSGTALAGDSLATLGNVDAEAMTSAELDAVVGAASFELNVPKSAPGTSVCPIDCAKGITGRADGRSGSKGLDLAEHKPGADGLNWND